MSALDNRTAIGSIILADCHDPLRIIITPRRAALRLHPISDRRVVDAFMGADPCETLHPYLLRGRIRGETLLAPTPFSSAHTYKAVA